MMFDSYYNKSMQGSRSETIFSKKIVVIGAGQAGLAMGYYLKRSGIDFVLLDKAMRLGESWRSRYDSLKLFTPAQYDSLPGLPFPASKETYPSKDDVAIYLEFYAKHFALPIQLGTRIELLEKNGDVFCIRTNQGSLEATRVVVATGPFQTPFTPSLSQQLDESIIQLHSSEYLNQRQLSDGEVVVVGSGNSGLQIAEELLKSHRVTLAMGNAQPFLPQTFLGQSLFWWMESLGISRVPAKSWLGRRLERRDPVIGTNFSALRRNGLKTTSRVVEARGKTVTFEDGSTANPQSIIWATGFRPDFSWLRLPVIDDKGKPIHHQGITSVEGLYFLGLSWQRTRGSALLGWVGQDAAFMARQLER
jgi:putative flavoprotein involved in K+ transport